MTETLEQLIDKIDASYEAGYSMADPMLHDQIQCLADRTNEIKELIRDAARYRWLRELPNADALNIRFCGADLDLVSDEGIGLDRNKV